MTSCKSTSSLSCGAGGAGGEGSLDLGPILESNGFVVKVGRFRLDLLTVVDERAAGLLRSSRDTTLLSFEKLTRIFEG